MIFQNPVLEQKWNQEMKQNLDEKTKPKSDPKINAKPIPNLSLDTLPNQRPNQPPNTTNTDPKTASIGAQLFPWTSGHTLKKIMPDHIPPRHPLGLLTNSS